MMKSEYATDQVRNRLAGRGPVQLDELIAEAWMLTDDGDPRWVGVALMHLSGDGEVTYPTCDHNHHHDGSCTVEAA